MENLYPQLLIVPEDIGIPCRRRLDGMGRKNPCVILTVGSKTFLYIRTNPI